MGQLTTSLAYVFMPFYGPPGVDLTALPVFMALMPDDGSDTEPGSGDWHTAAWISPDGIKPKEGALLVGPTPGQTYPAGDYVVFGKLTATPETPVMRGGRWKIGVE